MMDCKRAILLAGAGLVFSAGAADEALLKSQLKTGDKEAVLFTDVTGDGKPELLETWWNGKRCRWFDENGDMKKSDRRGDMVGDSLQVDMDGDGSYDGPADMNIKWTDNDADGMADLMTVAINPEADQKEIRGRLSHYMHFVDLDHDGVNHYIDWQTFNFNAWRHTGGCNFSPDYNGNSLFLKVHLPPWALEDPRINWENPFAFYDFDHDGCTEMAIRCVSSPKKIENGYGYSTNVGTVQMAFDLDNSSQRGNEQSLDMTLEFWGGDGIEYAQYSHTYPTLKAPDWVLPYYNKTNYREIDELLYLPHEQCYDIAMQSRWGRSDIAFDEDGDSHRWERIFVPEKGGDPYVPNDPKNKHNNSLVRGVKSDTLGDRFEWDDDFSGKGKLYIGPWDGKLHLFGAETGVWLVDDGTYGCKGNTPRATSHLIAPKVGEVVQYEDTDQDGFYDLVTFDYDGDRTIDLRVDLKQCGVPQPELIDPASTKWQGLHKTFNAMARKSWGEAQLLYRAAWRAGLTDQEIEELAIAASTWEKYDHGYWLKAKIFRKADQVFAKDAKKQAALRQAYFSGNFEAMAQVVAEYPR